MSNTPKTYELRSDTLTAKFTSHGATLTHLLITDAHGVRRDIVLGFDSPEEYVKAGRGSNPYFGATAGRVCNRITKGTFQLNGQQYQVPVNNGPNSLHGGVNGFDKRQWVGEQITASELRFTYTAQDGEEGYPGVLDVTATYRLDGGDLHIDYEARLNDAANPPDMQTLVNMTNHTYFNLTGLAEPTIVDHVFETTAKNMLELTETQVPTGKVLPTAHTAFDFSARKTFAPGLEPHHEHVKQFKGYDHFFVIHDDSARSPASGVLPPSVAKMSAPSTGISLTLATTARGYQLYTGNFLLGDFTAKASSQPHGVVYGKHAGVCLETSGWVDALSHDAWRKDVVIGKRDVWQQSTLYRFAVAST
ncbi:hypothetical protein HDU87_004657 [Geranomyces variabilis]|uniref:Aldose 1-epimerase n=1 Tax=Geranomyces variabilis TaxID=109894 RepID=A0AAD5TKG1_9FUNG|nr:hypothetical protein HDU87_004657 [Geranomyces variabilis]